MQLANKIGMTFSQCAKIGWISREVENKYLEDEVEDEENNIINSKFLSDYGVVTTFVRHINIYFIFYFFLQFYFRSCCNILFYLIL